MYGIRAAEFTGRGEDYLNFTHPEVGRARGNHTRQQVYD
jgi:hypothetical protein